MGVSGNEVSEGLVVDASVGKVAGKAAVKMAAVVAVKVRYHTFGV